MNEKQIRDHVATCFHKNFLVEAGAGAGKSTLIVNRIINQIMEDESPLKDQEPIHLSEIVAITFTEKAANELQFKFQREIRKRLDQSDLSNEAKEKLSEALKDIDSIFINTVHSFCMKLLMEMPFYSDLTIGFEPLDEVQHRTFKARIWDQFLTEKKSPQMESLILKIQQDNIRLDNVKDLYMELCENKSLGLTIEYNANAIDPVDKIMSLLEQLHHFFKSFDSQKMINKGKFDKHPKETLELIFENDAFNKRELTLDLAKTLLKIGSIGDLFGKKYINTEEYKRSEVFPMLELKQLMNEYKEYLYHVSMSFADEAYQRYEREKHQQMKVSFNDLLFKVYKMLKSSHEAREFFSKKYKCIYVDEFQDTDPLQTKILYLLTAENHDHHGVWTQCQPKPGSLFFVGDPKQSIYRFRQADIGIYNHVKSMVEPLDDWEVVTFRWNFRSSHIICEWVENQFMVKQENPIDEMFITKSGTTKFFLNESTKYQTIFKGMESKTDKINQVKGTGTNQLCGVYSYDLGATSAADIKRVDPEFLSTWIKHLVDQKYTIIDPRDGAPRPVQYSDFLILLRTQTGMIKYINALKTKGIPVTFAGKVNLYEIEEAANFIDLIGLLNDPKDAIRFIGVLYNSFGVDVSSEELAVIPKDPQEVDIRSVRLSTLLFHSDKIPFQDKILQKAINKISTYLEWKRNFSPIQCVEKIVDDYVALLKTQYDYQNLKSAVGTLYYMVEILKEKNPASFFELAKLMEEMKSLDIDRELGIDYEVNEHGEKSSVRIMNLHKAKGLEGNIVILAKPCGDLDRKRFPITKHFERDGEREQLYICLTKDYGVGVSIVGVPPKWGEKEQEETKFADTENLRLLYVAATRATQVLVIGDGQSEKSENPWKLLLEEDRGVSIAVESFLEPHTCEVKEEHKIEEFVPSIETKLQKREQLNRPSFVAVTPSTLDTERKGIVQEKEKDVLDFEPNPMPYGPDWGTMVHRMFELSFQPTSDIEHIARQSIHETLSNIKITEKTLKPLGIDPFILDFSEIERVEEAAKGLVPKLIETFRYFKDNKELLAMIDAAETIYTEMPFYMIINKNSGEKADEEIYTYLTEHSKQNTDQNETIQLDPTAEVLRVTGIMDLVLKQRNTYTIIDYKTNRLVPNLKEKLLSRYRSQLLAYEQILRKLTNGEIQGVYLYSTAMDLVIGT